MSQKDFLYSLKEGMHKVEDLAEELAQGPGNFFKIHDLKQTTQWISDISMVHGFEGVQTISEKLSHSIDDSIRSKRLSAALLVRVRRAVAAMRDVADLEANIEHNLTVESVTERAEIDRMKVFDRTEEFSRRVKVDFPEPASNDAVELPEEDLAEPEDEVKVVEGENKNKLMFDITEVDSVMHLIDNEEIARAEQEELEAFDRDED